MLTWDTWSFILVRCSATPSTAWNEEWTACRVDSSIMDTDLYSTVQYSTISYSTVPEGPHNVLD